MSNKQDTEPDRVHTCSLSRRHALALGAGTMGGLAGCSGFSDTLSGSNGPVDETTTERPPLSEKIEASAEFTINEATLKLDISSYTENSLSGRLRLYSAPNLDRSSRSVIAEKSIEQTDEVAEHSLKPDYDLGYAQHLQFTIESEDAGQTDERSIYTPQETIVPFHNAARDTDIVKVEPPRIQFDWAGGRDEPFFKTQVWFDSPDESPFNTPSVPEDQYDPNWYNYRNITMTAMVRFPSYDHIYEVEEGSRADEERGGEVGWTYPLFDWVVFTLELDAWEMLEAFRWNSQATCKLERGQSKYGEGLDEVDEYTISGSVMKTTDYATDASTETNPYEAYSENRYSESWTETNPLLIAGGRPFAKRAANTISDALDNPSFNTIENQEYHKALVLQVFAGSNPYVFGFDSYAEPPEGVINGWFRDSRGEDVTGDCQDGTNLYNAIAVHLLDSTVANVYMSANNEIAHELAGLLNLSPPQEAIEEWEDQHPSPMATGVSNFETNLGEVSFVECTYPDPTIGWLPRGGSDFEILTYLTKIDINSHIPINNNYEPDESGQASSSTSEIEIPWEYHEEHTTVDDIENFS